MRNHALNESTHGMWLLERGNKEIEVKSWQPRTARSSVSLLVRAVHQQQVSRLCEGCSFEHCNGLFEHFAWDSFLDIVAMVWHCRA